MSAFAKGDAFGVFVEAEEGTEEKELGDTGDEGEDETDELGLEGDDHHIEGELG